jgi:signal transduction histidine kinase
VHEERFDLHYLVEDNVRLFATIANHKKIQLTHNVPKYFYVKADKHIMNLVLRNLISNAIKFSFEGGSIHVQVDKDDDSLHIRIKDQGKGMDEETLRALSQPHKTVSTVGTGNEKGTGLGLALIREYLEKAAGKIMIESEVGKGSIFTVILPLKD